MEDGGGVKGEGAAEQGSGVASMTRTPSGAEIVHRELENERVVHEVRFCGYGEYRAAIEACDKTLSKVPGKTELQVLAKLKDRYQGAVTTMWSKTLIFGDQVRGLSKTEKAALVCLVRRGLVNVWRIVVSGTNGDGVHEGGSRHQWEFKDASA